MNPFPPALLFNWILDPHKKNDLVALSYVLAFLASRSPLPWHAQYQDIIADALSNDTFDIDVAFNTLALLKVLYSEKCCEGLPPLYLKFMKEVLDLSPDSNFDYNQYSSEFEDLCIRQWEDCSL